MTRVRSALTSAVWTLRRANLLRMVAIGHGAPSAATLLQRPGFGAAAEDADFSGSRLAQYGALNGADSRNDVRIANADMTRVYRSGCTQYCRAVTLVDGSGLPYHLQSRLQRWSHDALR